MLSFGERRRALNREILYTIQILTNILLVQDGLAQVLLKSGLQVEVRR
jgi:hypothetical protein